jgi:hypothetical protein
MRIAANHLESALLIAKGVHPMHSINARVFLPQNPHLKSIRRSRRASLLPYRFVECLLAFICFALPSLSQQNSEVIRHGTIAIIAIRPDQIVAAIDSAIYDPNEDYPPGIGCKMIGLGKRAFFLIVGLGGVKGEFSSNVLAQQAFAKMRDINTPKRRRGVATEWGKLLVANVTRSKYPVLAGIRAANIQTAGVFGFESSTGKLYLPTDGSCKLVDRGC